MGTSETPKDSSDSPPDEPRQESAQVATPASAIPELNRLRSRIDAIDDQLIDLLNQRARLAQDVGEVKAKHALRAYAPERERLLLDRLTKKSTGPLPSESLRLIYKEIISASLALESPLQVAFLGPEATFTHQATKAHFGLSARLRPLRTIPDVFAEVERGRCDYGVVPIENTTEGVVSHTLDMFAQSDLVICAEVLLSVSFHLLTRSGELAGITKVYSHPQALEGCRLWLDTHLPGATLVDVSNTARAAALAAEDESAAAVASDMAASIYGLQIAASNLDDDGGNLTRFLVIGRDVALPTTSDRTSIMFALKDEPGILYRALKCFADVGINMSRIESRPSRKKAWEYLFFVDLEGHQHAPSIATAIENLAHTCVFMKVLGSYPQGVLGGSVLVRK